MTTPLILSRDPVLLDELSRLCAAAGLTPESSGDAFASLRGWSDASVVLVGIDLAGEVAAVSPPRRRGVHLVGSGVLPADCYKLAVDLGADSVVELPRSETWLLELLSDLDGAGVEATMIGVIGGSGGAGATTFACALASVAARDRQVCAIDVDPCGPGLDSVLGLSEHDGVRWDALQHTTGRLSARALRESIPSRAGLRVVTFGPLGPDALVRFAVREVSSAAVRGHDLVVLDLPRSGGEVVDDLVARCQQIVVVTRGTAAGLTQTVRTLRHVSGPRALVLRGPAPDRQHIEDVLGLPVVGQVPEVRTLQESIDLGLGPVRSRRSAMARAVRGILAELDQQPVRGAAA